MSDEERFDSQRNRIGRASSLPALGVFAGNFKAGKVPALPIDHARRNTAIAEAVHPEVVGRRSAAVLGCEFERRLAAGPRPSGTLGELAGETPALPTTGGCTVAEETVGWTTRGRFVVPPLGGPNRLKPGLQTPTCRSSNGLVNVHMLLLAGCLLGAAVAQEKPAPQKPVPGLRPATANEKPQATASTQIPLPEGARVYRDLEYVPGGHERQKLDLYLPKEGNHLPLIVWVHGGAWLGGNKDRCPAVPFLREGYAAASINYRLSQHAVFPAQIEDCKAAIRWLRANAAKYGIDPGHIGVWGSSAGGHLAALLGTTGDVKEFETGENLQVTSRVQAVCDWFGPTDFTQMSKFASRIDHDAADSPESKLIGGPVQQHKEKAARANPITFVSKDDPPFLIMHGDQDPLVPMNQSELLQEALKVAGVNTTLHVVRGGGHGFGGPDINRMVREFFAKHLK